MNNEFFVLFIILRSKMAALRTRNLSEGIYYFENCHFDKLAASNLLLIYLQFGLMFFNCE